jgi:serine/threonine-protein kinase
MAEAEDLTGIPKPGDIIAEKFEVERVLGVGGMGVVVAARHIHLGQRVAVKFLRARAAENKEAALRFVREARAAVALQSPHVVRVTDVGTLATGLPYMVMEHLSGDDLSTVIEQRGALPVEEACDYVLQACEALAEAHAAGIVHRDLKPSNLFLTRKPDGSPFVKVLDFGISKAIDPSAQEQNLTATSSVMGSPLYMSPEQLRSAKKVDLRTDVWALGVILFELTTGRTPFEDETMTGLCAKIVADPPVSLRALRPELPLVFEGVVTRCLDKDVVRRYQSVGELATALRDLASLEGKLAADRVARIGAPRAPMPSGAAFAVASAPASGGQPLAITPELASSPRPPVSGHTGFADTVGAWQSDGTKSRRTTALAAIAIACVLGALGIGAFVFTRESSRAAAPPAETNVIAPAAAPTETSSAAATIVAAASSPPGAPSTAPSASTSSASSAKPRAPVARPAGGPAKPPPAQGDLLLDRK